MKHSLKESFCLKFNAVHDFNFYILAINHVWTFSLFTIILRPIFQLKTRFVLIFFGSFMNFRFYKKFSLLRWAHCHMLYYETVIVLFCLRTTFRCWACSPWKNSFFICVRVISTASFVHGKRTKTLTRKMLYILCAELLSDIIQCTVRRLILENALAFI